MAKFILICTRNGKQIDSFSKKIQTLSKRLIPDNISPDPPLIIQEKGLSISIFNPCSNLPVEKTSVCMGNLLQPRDDWWRPSAEIPDGSYALFRSDKDTIELISDYLGSRTIWYIHTDNEFIASTSQRAIIFFLQDFQPNPDVYPWMLSSGTLGPGLSWDTRIKFLAGNTRLILDRPSWKVALLHEPVRFTPSDIPDDRHESQLKEAIEWVCENLDIDYKKWILPLSGGLDSRAILLFTRNRENLKCITWGISSSLKDKKNDAYIAKSLAEHLNVEHEFFDLESSSTSFDSIFRRFLTAGEGRTDNIAGYMDGFRVWKHLFESGYQGILRGDQAFGNRTVSRVEEVYKNMGCNILTDYENLHPVEDVIRKYGQSRPFSLEKGEDESLESFRDRVNSEFEIPIILAALSDLKLSYVEIVNPFLSRRIVQQVRQLPDDLRTNKRLFRKIIQHRNPDIPLAQHRAIATTKDFLKSQKEIDYIADELSSNTAKFILPDSLIRYILQNMKITDPGVHRKTPVLHSLIGQLAPKKIKKSIKRTMKRKILGINILALRACLICKMHKIFLDDINVSHQG